MGSTWPATEGQAQPPRSKRLQHKKTSFLPPHFTLPSDSAPALFSCSPGVPSPPVRPSLPLPADTQTDVPAQPASVVEQTLYVSLTQDRVGLARELIQNTAPPAETCLSEFFATAPWPRIPVVTTRKKSELTSDFPVIPFLTRPFYSPTCDANSPEPFPPPAARRPTRSRTPSPSSARSRTPSS